MHLLLVLFLAIAGAQDDPQTHDHEHPDLAVRIDQAALELPAIADAIRQATDDDIRKFRLELKEDGLHASGDYRLPILGGIHFKTAASPVWKGPNVFEVRIRKTKVLIFDVTGRVVDAVEAALRETLDKVCTFQRLGRQADGSHSIRVTVDMKGLMPTLPRLFLSGISTRDKVLVLKAKLPH
ncbi:MAG: hypothetical protein HY553_05775 [Elusimicrobia bacterium]|nr:hypothetical protein [Elusimicrobiota bacterium]